MKAWKSLIIGVCLGAFAQLSHAIPMLTFDNGKVTGATGIVSDGMTFTMEFVDGSCISLFGGCDEDADFLVPDAGVTHGALLTEFFNIFIAAPPPSNMLDGAPDLALGCATIGVCTTFAPTTLSPTNAGVVSVVSVLNFATAADLSDVSFTENRARTATTVDVSQFNFAIFSKQPPNVPAPGSLALLALGLAVLGYGRKRAI